MTGLIASGGIDVLAMVSRRLTQLCGCLLALLFCAAAPISAQDDGCATPRSFAYPIDTNVFQLVQDFGVASQRHQGRFHTGEDWFGGIGTSLGQPVRAAAAGLVTYSSPQGWGRDAGVIILRHTFADGSVYYTQYGHITESAAYSFPTRLTCVEAGDILGVIADVRPAPHVHFEVRINQPDIPGPGYTWDDPVSLGWRRPAQMVADLQARFNTAYEWSLTVSASQNPPPVLLNDYSLIAADGDRLRRITADGRVWWRETLPSPIVSVAGYSANTYITYPDGTISRVNLDDGSVSESWQINFTPDLPPLPLNDGSYVYHTADNALVALAADLRSALWRLDGVPAYQQGIAGGSLIGLVIDDELWLIAPPNTPVVGATHASPLLVGQASLRNGANLSLAPDGALIVYTYGGLWRIDAAGLWSEVIAGVPPGGDNAAAVVTGDGRAFLVNGSSIWAYNSNGLLAWQAGLPYTLAGRVSMTYRDGFLLITGNHGFVIALRENGSVCNSIQLYGDDLAGLWREWSHDGMLRLAVGNQLLGLDWQRFIGGC